MTAKLKSRKKTRPPGAANSGIYGYDLIVRAAWLYYQDGRTQHEIAEILGVSRASVVNYIQKARDRSIVSIQIKSEIVASVELAQQLRQRFNLDDAVVVPDGGDEDDNAKRNRVADAGANYLLDRLQNGGTLGVAWGRTIRALAERIPKATIANLTVCQIVGSARSAEWLWAEQCSTDIARRLGGRCLNMHAPAIVSRPEVRDILLSEPLIADQFALIKGCDVVCFGICSLEPSSLIFESGLVSKDEGDSFVKNGAAGVIGGRFFDHEGAPFDTDYDRRLMAMRLDELLAIPVRIAVAAGPLKIPALLAAMRGKYTSVLVTDAHTAHALLEHGQ